MNLAYFAADTLGVTLYQMPSGTLKATETHQTRMGPWRIDLPLDVDSDVMTGTELSFWVTLNKTLRVYLVVRAKETWMFVLNTETLKACGQETGFAGATTKVRVTEFKPAIRGLFHWDDGKWAQVAI